MHPAAPTAPTAHLYAPRRKLYSDCRLALERKLVAREAAQQIGLANARVANKHHFEQVVVAAAGARRGLASAAVVGSATAGPAQLPRLRGGLE
jgi:hypothetical protein